ncbi:hypothetical protein [Spirosoma linguale]|uniref:hypothetical protein n=1 Tax=Spirosoma linguale TaxID=108 RepID=UPI0001A3AC36
MGQHGQKLVFALVGLLKGFFGLFAAGNVTGRPKPFPNPSLLIQQGNRSGKSPA